MSESIPLGYVGCSLMSIMLPMYNTVDDNRIVKYQTLWGELEQSSTHVHVYNIYIYIYIYTT